MSKFRREEDEADKWLREHDPYYTSSDRDKRKKMSNPYETPEQEKRRRETEIPLSKKYGTTVDTLVKLNGIKNKNLINIGQVIKLP